MFYDRSQDTFPNWWELLDDPVDEAFDSVDPSEAKRTASPASGSSCGGTVETALSFDWPSEGEAEEEGADEEVGAKPLSRGYEREVILSVWRFARVVPGNDPELWRKDEFGNWIHRLDYGSRHSEFGWEIFDPGVGRHHQGIYAMRPMQWQSYVQQFETLNLI